MILNVSIFIHQLLNQFLSTFFSLQAVIQNMKVTCKCHGVSGSCSLITCWQQLAPFRKIGDHLEEKYGRSTRVKTTRAGRLRVRRKAKNVPTANDLVFLERSPNYCHANDTIGSLGMSFSLRQILQVPLSNCLNRPESCQHFCNCSAHKTD